jgi:hypothetical protein
MVVKMRSVCVLLFISTLFSVGNALAAAELNRLFTTPDERRSIDKERQEALLILSDSAKAGVEERKSSTRIALDAVLIGYQKVIWINKKLIDKATEVNGILIDPKNVNKKGLWIETPSGKKLIKQGQVYLTELGKVVERYEAL